MKTIIESPNLEFIPSESQLISTISVISPLKNFHPEEEVKQLYYKNPLKRDNTSNSQIQNEFSSYRSELVSGRFNFSSFLIQPLETMNYPEEPVQLLKTNSDNKFELCESGLKIIESIKGSIAIVSFAGMFRTGKSYLLNLLLNKQNNGVVFNSLKYQLRLILVLKDYGFGALPYQFKIEIFIFFL